MNTLPNETDLVAAAVLACFFAAFLVFAIGRMSRALVPDDRTRRRWFFIVMIAIAGVAGGWSIYRVVVRILGSSP